MKIWDSFIRVYHWSQVVLLGSLWYTADEGLMEWHFALAYLLMVFLLTRIVWELLAVIRQSSLILSPRPRKQLLI